MKRTVTIIVDIDPTEYHLAEDSAQGAIDIIIDGMRAEADFPSLVTIACEGVIKQVNLDE